MENGRFLITVFDGQKCAINKKPQPGNAGRGFLSFANFPTTVLVQLVDYLKMNII
jgi:hypothetical protein